MFCSVYPQGPPSQSGGRSPWIMALFACGGCALLVILALVAATIFGMKFFGGAAKGYLDQPRKAEIFLTHLREKRYADATQLMSPEGQKTLTEAKLKQSVEATVSRLGALEGWRQDQNIDTQTQNNQAAIRYRYRLQFQKGESDGVFTFRITDPLNPSSLIEHFEITESHPVRPGDAPGDRRSKDTLP